MPIYKRRHFLKLFYFPEIITFTSVRFTSDPTEAIRRENVCLENQHLCTKFQALGKDLY